MATSNTESLDSTTGLSPLEVESIEHVYKSLDAPMSKNFVDQYYVMGKDCISADKWFTTSNNRPFHIRFPAHVNRLYKDSKISSYGNNTDTGKLDLKVLKKLKMIFALDPVTDGPDHISNKALFVMDTLHYIQQTYNNTLNHGNYYIFTLAHLPDPSNRFSSICSIAANVKLSLPNVLDNDGVLILPLLYNTKFCHGCLVDVTITCCMWPIRGDAGNPKGSRVYQL
ncbi:hypothetical protein K439DRAFT_1621003 [Ramaria rubella]|nr:hypothetical protein K439DRAFT_1621003 [Ramaria rubella]